MKSYSKSHIGCNIGTSYDKKLNNKFENFIFEIEKKIIKKIIKKYYNGKISNFLDFACGTGRITKIIDKYSKLTIGVDISRDMLKIAKKKYKNIKFLNKNISKTKINKRFDLITAWRFFLNAEYKLKKEILLRLRDLLKENGYLIFNIHMNRSSIIGFQFFIRKKIFKQKVINTMSIYDIKKLLKQTKYKLIEIYPLAYFPGRLNTLFLPKKILLSIELWLTNKKSFRGLAKDLIVIAKK